MIFKRRRYISLCFHYKLFSKAPFSALFFLVQQLPLQLHKIHIIGRQRIWGETA